MYLLKGQEICGAKRPVHLEFMFPFLDLVQVLGHRDPLSMMIGSPPCLLLKPTFEGSPRSRYLCKAMGEGKI
jgi:hypothetical protein